METTRSTKGATWEVGSGLELSTIFWQECFDGLSNTRLETDLGAAQRKR